MICPSCNQPTQPVGRLSMNRGVVRHCGHATCGAVLPDEPEPVRAPRRDAPEAARVAALAPRVEQWTDESAPAAPAPPVRSSGLPSAPDYAALMRQELAGLSALAEQIATRRTYLLDMIARLGSAPPPVVAPSHIVN